MWDGPLLLINAYPLVDLVDSFIKMLRLPFQTCSTEYDGGCCGLTEKLVEEQRKFDAVLALEVCNYFFFRRKILQ